ncbi:MAG: hypothetical protein IT257_06775 [Chitinophagaceae bacterium]|nr:hypothetical protein [Chitinophagaceae bacterium]
MLELTDYSPLGGLEDKPENFHTFIYILTVPGDQIEFKLSKDQNADVAPKKHSQKMWQKMLEEVKKVVEQEKQSQTCSRSWLN